MINIKKYDEPHSALLPKGTTVTLYTFTVPQKSKLTITHFGNYINQAPHWGHVTWRVLQNGIICLPPILDNLGLSSLPEATKKVELNGGDVLSVTVTDDNVLAQPPVLSAGMRIKFELQ